jgi:DNA-binding transcriptional LysR family regulator
VDSAREPLIALPATEALTRLFQKGFDQRGEGLSLGVEVGSLDSMKVYVVGGFGIGLAVATPEPGGAAEIRMLPIPRFPKLILGAFWSGKLPELARSFLERAEGYAAKLR